MSAAAVRQKTKCEGCLSFGLFGGNRLDDFATTNATGADLDGHNLTGFKLVTNLLQVGHEAAFCFDVGVADVIAALGTLSTYIANLRHCDLLAYSYRIITFLTSVAGRGW